MLFTNQGKSDTITVCNYATGLAYDFLNKNRTLRGGFMEQSVRYKRVLIKISGEALATGTKDGILNYDFVREICQAIKECNELGVQVALVVGAGNIWSGRQGGDMDRTRADHMGMLATAINALAIQDAFVQMGVDCRVMTAIAMHEVAEPYIRNKAVSHLEKGRTVIFGCGIGSPFFSTDTAAVLRAAEINADVVMMAKNIDGVYTADPKIDPNAVKLDEISYMDILKHDMKVIDGTAASFGKDNHIPLHIFGLDDPKNIVRAIKGEKIGTIVTGA